MAMSHPPSAAAAGIIHTDQTSGGGNTSQASPVAKAPRVAPQHTPRRVRTLSRLSVGMSVSDAIDLLGEPGHRSGDELIYFYYATTIELVTQKDTVKAVVLARAMP